MSKATRNLFATVFGILCLLPGRQMVASDLPEDTATESFVAPNALEPLGDAAVENTESEFEQASLQVQNPAAAQPNLLPPSAAPNSRRPILAPALRFLPRRNAPASRSKSLASTPPIFGDFFLSGGTLVADDGLIATTDLPLGGATGRFRVSDNNKALPDDRIIFQYNHFHNALTGDASQFIVGPDRESFSVDRFIIGGEKTLFDGLASVQVQLPMATQFDFFTPNFSVNGGTLGNLSITTKVVLWENETTAFAGGLGLDVPTGDDTRGHVNITEYFVRNDAVHIQPYLAWLTRPNEDWFIQSFLEVDVAANGNRLELQSPILGIPLTKVGKINEQTLLGFDLSVGRWLYRNDGSQWLTGAAGLFEVHYTTPLQDADQFVISDPLTTFNFGNSKNRLDIVDFTVGLHTVWDDKTEIRVGASFPFRHQDRTFDSEIQAFVNRRF